MVDLGNVHDIDEAVTQHIGDGRTYRTLEDNLEFRGKFEAPRDLVLVFLPGRSTSRTMVQHKERVQVWRRWLQTKSFAPGEYQDISRNASYLLAVLRQLTM